MKLKILCISLIIAFFSFPTICFSEKPDTKVWEFLGTSNQGDSYYNKTDITKSSNIISIWIYVVVKDDVRKEEIENVKKYDGLEKSIKYQNYDHYLSLLEIDCKNRVVKPKEKINYNYKREVLDRHIIDFSEWASIPPESFSDSLYQKFCVTQKDPDIETLMIIPKTQDSKDWEYYSDGWYYNKTNITKSSNIIKVWTYHDLEKSGKLQNIDHIEILEEIDCKNRQGRWAKWVEYDDKRNVLDTKNGFSEWIEFKPNSGMEKLYQKVCVTQKNKPLQDEVKLIKNGGVYEVPVILNDVLAISFILDSGASDVSISPDVALTLIKTKTISNNDWLPGAYYRFANGTTAKSKRFKLKSVKIGNMELTNVTCSISNSIEAPMLLGQSALQKLRSYSIDYEKNVMIFK